MKYTIPHEPVEPYSRVIPLGRYDSRRSIFSNLRNLDKKSRVLSFLSYFGLAPFLWFSGVSQQKTNALKHHVEYGLGFALLPLFAITLYEIEYLFVQFINIYAWRPSSIQYADLMQKISPLLTAIDSVVILLITYFGILWFISLIDAWRGQTTRNIVLSKLISNPFAQVVAAYWFLLIDILVIAVIFMSIRSAQLANRSSSEDAKVYVLYTIGGYIPVESLFETYTPPQWIVTLGFYPLVTAGIDKYGENGVAVLPLTEENFDQAIGKGKFIFIASHGGSEPGSFSLSILPHIQYLPSDILSSHVGNDLQFAYFAGCYTGDLETEWKQVLDVENVIMFDRLSYVDEHMLWVWFKSPAVIKKLQ